MLLIVVVGEFEWGFWGKVVGVGGFKGFFLFLLLGLGKLGFGLGKGFVLGGRLGSF